MQVDIAGLLCLDYEQSYLPQREDPIIYSEWHPNCNRSENVSTLSLELAVFIKSMTPLAAKSKWEICSAREM